MLETKLTAFCTEDNYLHLFYRLRQLLHFLQQLKFSQVPHFTCTLLIHSKGVQALYFSIL